MTTVTGSTTHRIDVLRPLAAAAVGAVTYAAAFIAGDVFELNADSPDAPATTTGEVFAYVGLVLAAGVIAVGVAAWALAGSPRRVAGSALGLGVAGVVTFVAFWSGWPLVFGAVAVFLALEHRRRIGSLSGPSATGLGLGALAFVVSAVFCVIG